MCRARIQAQRCDRPGFSTGFSTEKYQVSHPIRARKAAKTEGLEESVKDCQNARAAVRQFAEKAEIELQGLKRLMKKAKERIFVPSLRDPE